MNEHLEVSRIFEIGLDAIRYRAEKRIQVCIEKLLRLNTGTDAEPEENPSYALLVLLDYGASNQDDSRISLICIEGLREMYAQSQGALRFLLRLTLHWPLSCLSCHVNDRETKQKLTEEIKSLGKPEPAPIDLSTLPLLWYWSRQSPHYHRTLFCFLVHNIEYAIKEKLNQERVKAEPLPWHVIEEFVVERRQEFTTVEEAMSEIVRILNTEKILA